MTNTVKKSISDEAVTKDTTTMMTTITDLVVEQPANVTENVKVNRTINRMLAVIRMIITPTINSNNNTMKICVVQILKRTPNGIANITVNYNNKHQLI